MASTTYLQQAYLAYFGRPADVSGLSFYADKTEAQVVAAFSASAESQAFFGSLNTLAQINTIYQNLFNRAAEPAGLTYWAGEINSGRLSLAQASMGILAGAQNADKLAVTNKLAAATAFTAALDTTEEMVGYQGTSVITSARAYLASVDSTAASLTAATATAALTASVSTVVAAGTTSSSAGSTFTLTSTLESFTGTSGADTFVGDNNTTSAGDTLTGGSGNDTLKLFGNAAKPTFSGIETVFLSGNTAGFDVSSNADVTLLDLDDPTTAQTYTTTTGQAVKVATMAAGETITLAGNTPTSLTVTLNSVAASGADVTLATTGTALATLNLTTATAASQITLTNAGAAISTVNVAGTQRLELGHALTTITTINASTATGAVDIDTVGASALAFTGGSGADRINLVATLGTTDSIKGGAGSDTVAISDADTLTTLSGAVVSAFEILEVTTADATAFDVDTLIGTNSLTGILITETGGGGTTVNNINSAAINNISFTADTPTAIALTGKGFSTGGISDTATVILNNSVDDNADGVDVATTLTFTQVDRLTVQATSDATTAARTIVNSIAGLTATDLDLLTITGNAAVSVNSAATTASVQEIDASTSTGAVTAVTTATALAALIYRGNSNVDTVTFNNAATNAVTLFTGGGSDVLVLGVTGATHTLNFNATDFTTGDVKAGNAITINTGAAFQAGDTVTLDFSAAFEALLKVGGVTAAATAANFTLVGGTLGATTNMIAVDGGNNTTLQIDLNGDGAFTAASDFSIEILGLANNTLNYVAATDVFTFTATA